MSCAVLVVTMERAAGLLIAYPLSRGRLYNTPLGDSESRGDLCGALEWVARTYSLAIEHDLPIISQVKPHLARLREKYGLDRFAEWWQEFIGGNPPIDLDANTIDRL